MLYAVTQDEAGATEVHKGFDSLQRSPDPTLILSSLSLSVCFSINSSPTSQIVWEKYIRSI